MYVFEDITRKHVGFRRKSGNWKWIPPGWMLLADADTESEKGIILLLKLSLKICADIKMLYHITMYNIYIISTSYFKGT